MGSLTRVQWFKGAFNTKGLKRKIQYPEGALVQRAGRDSRDQGRLQSGDRLARLNNDVSEVTSLLRDNVEKIVERGEKISNLHDRSEDLASNSQKFTYSAREVRKKMCYQNYRLTAIIVIVVLVVIGIIVVIILAGTKTI